MAKLADAPDLGSGAARRGGSSPLFRTNSKLHKSLGNIILLYFYDSKLNFLSLFCDKSCNQSLFRILCALYQSLFVKQNF